jgi:hypothetical protein
VTADGRSRWAAAVLAAVAAFGCGGDDDDDGAETRPAYATSVEAFEPGRSAGFGQEDLPDVVLGPPGGMFDVVSLGFDGRITLGFGTRAIVDGPGPDFVVFENPFVISAGGTFVEPGRVEVSIDGEDWIAFPCSSEDPFTGCAGLTPTAAFDVDAPLDPALSGGDAFDLSDLGLAAVQLVRIVDQSNTTDCGNACGFDLDAIGVVHFDPDRP